MKDLHFEDKLHGPLGTCAPFFFDSPPIFFDSSPFFWFLMNGEEIDHYGEIVATAKTSCKECEFIICNDILENISRPHKPVFPTPNKNFILTWNNWEVSSKKYEELLITNGKECQIMIKRSSTNIHFTVQGVQRTYFDLDE